MNKQTKLAWALIGLTVLEFIFVILNLFVLVVLSFIGIVALVIILSHLETESIDNTIRKDHDDV